MWELWLRDSDAVLINQWSCCSTSLSKLVWVHATWCTIGKYVLMSACLFVWYWLRCLRSVGYCWLLLSSCPYLQLRHLLGSCGCTPTPTCKVWERHRLLILTLDGPIIINSLIFTEASHHYNKVIAVWLYISCLCCQCLETWLYVSVTLLQM